MLFVVVAFVLVPLGACGGMFAGNEQADERRRRVRESWGGRERAQALFLASSDWAAPRLEGEATATGQNVCV